MARGAESEEMLSHFPGQRNKMNTIHSLFHLFIEYVWDTYFINVGNIMHIIHQDPLVLDGDYSEPDPLSP